MRASLDTNAIIHFYRAGLQDILFDFFEEGVFIYEQIRRVELEHHGRDVLDEVDEDIAAGRIELYTDQNMPFTFADILILRFLIGKADERQTLRDFNLINDASGLNWALKSQVVKFIKRFFKEPWREEDRQWILEFIRENGISVKARMQRLRNLI